MQRSKNNQTPNLFNQKGAGRPRLNDEKVKWVRRETRASIPRNTPVHVTVKLKKNTIRTLRNKLVFKKIKLAMKRARNRGLGILHFSIQKDHIHMMIEARDRRHLGKGMQSFCISLGMSLKKLVKGQRKGIFRDRYHVHILNTPTEVKRTVRYIAFNGCKHGVIQGFSDAFSSAVLIKNLNLDFSRLFQNSHQFKKFKAEMKSLVDPSEFWLSRQMT